MEYEPLREKIIKGNIPSMNIEVFSIGDVKSAVKGARGEIDNLDIPVDQKFKIIGLFSKWFYDVIVTEEK